MRLARHALTWDAGRSALVESMILRLHDPAFHLHILTGG